MLIWAIIIIIIIILGSSANKTMWDELFNAAGRENNTDVLHKQHHIDTLAKEDLDPQANN
jgi:hypothetical protein